MQTIFLYTFLLSAASNLIIIFLANRYNYFIDDSESMKPQNFHSSSTPRAGGLGILVGLLMLITSPFGLKFLLSLALAFSSGIFEDLHNTLSPKLRLLLQLIAALVAMWLTGAVITYLGLGISLPYWVGVAFSAFAIVGMMNAVNIIDGFNGLAGGVILVILFSFGYIAYQHHNAELVSILALFSGAIMGFMVLNFPKGIIFLGDGGAYMLGLMVSILGIFLAGKYPDISPWYILSIFIYPVWEVIFSIARKIYIGLSPMQPDGKHMHMLIYKYVTKNNPLTAFFIFLTLLPSSFLSTLYSNNSAYNIIIIFCYIIAYLSFYRYLALKDANFN